MNIRVLFHTVVLLGIGSLALVHADTSEKSDHEKKGPDTVLGFEVKDIDGKAVKLGERYKGKVLLIVNTASQCGYTPQYADLQALYDEYEKKGLEVLAFPSNDFGAQEPGTNAEIKQFCSTKFHVTFPLFAKVAVKGDAQTPLYGFLTDAKTNPASSGEIKWNFTKFLVGRDGKIIARYEPAIKPTDPQVKKAVEQALAEKPSEKKPTT